MAEISYPVDYAVIREAVSASFGIDPRVRLAQYRVLPRHEYELESWVILASKLSSSGRRTGISFSAINDENGSILFPRAVGENRIVGDERIGSRTFRQCLFDLIGDPHSKAEFHDVFSGAVQQDDNRLGVFIKAYSFPAEQRLNDFSRKINSCRPVKFITGQAKAVNEQEFISNFWRGTYEIPNDDPVSWHDSLIHAAAVSLFYGPIRNFLLRNHLQSMNLKALSDLLEIRVSNVHEYELFGSTLDELPSIPRTFDAIASSLQHCLKQSTPAMNPRDVDREIDLLRSDVEQHVQRAAMAFPSLVAYDDHDEKASKELLAFVPPVLGLREIAGELMQGLGDRLRARHGEITGTTGCRSFALEDGPGPWELTI